MSGEIARVLSEYKERHSLKQVADRMGKAYSTLARKLNEHDPLDMLVGEIIPFVEATDYDFSLLDHIEARLGRVAVAIKTHGHACDIQGVCRLAKDFSDAMTAISKAISDNKISPREASQCIQELMDLAYTAMGLIRALQEIEKRGLRVV